jgi:Thioesterase superfamily
MPPCAAGSTGRLITIGIAPAKDNTLAATPVPKISYTLSMLVMPANTNSLGVMHGGWMMSWMDMAAWVVARGRWSPSNRCSSRPRPTCLDGADQGRRGVQRHGDPRHGGTHVAHRPAGGDRGDPTRKSTRAIRSATFTVVTGADGVAEPVRLASPRRRVRRA